MQLHHEVQMEIIGIVGIITFMVMFYTFYGIQRTLRAMSGDTEVREPPPTPVVHNHYTSRNRDDDADDDEEEEDEDDDARDALRRLANLCGVSHAEIEEADTWELVAKMARARLMDERRRRRDRDLAAELDTPVIRVPEINITVDGERSLKYCVLDQDGLFFSTDIGGWVPKSRATWWLNRADAERVVRELDAQFIKARIVEFTE